MRPPLGPVRPWQRALLILTSTSRHTCAMHVYRHLACSDSELVNDLRPGSASPFHGPMLLTSPDLRQGLLSADNVSLLARVRRSVSRVSAALVFTGKNSYPSQTRSTHTECRYDGSLGSALSRIMQVSVLGCYR